MDEVLLFGLGLPVIVTIIVQLLKRAGLPDDKAPWAALAAGIVLAYVAQLVAQYPQLVPILQPLIYALVTFGSASGMYIVGKQSAERLGIIKKKYVKVPVADLPKPLPTIVDKGNIA